MSTTFTHIGKWYAVAMLLQNGIASLFGGTITIAAWLIGAVVGIMGGWNDLAAYPDHIRAMWREKSITARDYSNQYARWHWGLGFKSDLLQKYHWMIPIAEHAAIDEPMHDPINGGWRKGAKLVEAHFILLVLLLWAIILTWR